MTCKGEAACEGTCVDVATEVQGLRVEILCGIGDPYCTCTNEVRTKTANITGSGSATYRLNLRIRGVIEQKEYVAAPTPGGAAGMNASFFVRGGNPKNDLWNVYKLESDIPSIQYHLNSGRSGNDFVDAIDYVVDIDVASGAKLVLSGDPVGVDMAKNRNEMGQPVTVPGFPVTNSQWVQVDVMSATRLPAK